MQIASIHMIHFFFKIHYGVVDLLLKLKKIIYCNLHLFQIMLFLLLRQAHFFAGECCDDTIFQILWCSTFGL